MTFDRSFLSQSTFVLGPSSLWHLQLLLGLGLHVIQLRPSICFHLLLFIILGTNIVYLFILTQGALVLHKGSKGCSDLLTFVIYLDPSSIWGIRNSKRPESALLKIPLAPELVCKMRDIPMGSEWRFLPDGLTDLTRRYNARLKAENLVIYPLTIHISQWLTFTEWGILLEFRDLLFLG